MEQYSLEDCHPWMETHIQARIAAATKMQAAKVHTKQALLLSRHLRNLLTYTDGSMLGNMVDAGVYVNLTASACSGNDLSHG